MLGRPDFQWRWIAGEVNCYEVKSEPKELGHFFTLFGDDDEGSVSNPGLLRAKPGDITR